MRNLLAFAAAVVLTFAIVGWYLDWYQVKNDSASAGHHNVNIDINGVKVVEDLKKGEEKIHQAIEKSQTDESNKGAETDSGKSGKQLPNE